MGSREKDAMHRGKEALALASQARAERIEHLDAARRFKLLAISRRVRARKAWPSMRAETLLRWAESASNKMRMEIECYHDLEERAIALEIQSRIAFEEAEERYARAPDEEWDLLAQRVVRTGGA